jgi:Protein of unknown function (DUF2384)
MPPRAGTRSRVHADLGQRQSEAVCPEDRAAELDQIREALAQIYTPDAVERWLHARTRALAGERPIDLIERGEGARVLALVQAISQLARSATKETQ